MAKTSNQQQRELVRLLYLEHGHQLASEMSGVRYDLVRQWAHRGNWDGPTKSVTNVTKRIVDRVQDELAENERETRLSLSRYARRAAQDAEKASLRESPYVKQVADIAKTTHKWDQQDKPSHFTLNMLNLNMFDGDSGPTIDVE